VALGVTEAAVSQWMKSGREGGEEALKAHPAKGARPRLTAVQQAHIPTVLAKGAVLAIEVIRSEKRPMRGECLLPLSHGVVCNDQETGRSSRESEPEEPMASQSSRVRRCCASTRGDEGIGHLMLSYL